MLKSLLRVFFVLFIVLTGVAKAELIKTEEAFTNPAQPLYLSSPSDLLVIKVKSNPTTGYAWYLQSVDAPWLQPVSHKYVPPLSQLAGASGYDVWTFKIDPAYKDVPFYSEIELIYTRPWQVNTAPTVFRVFYRPS